MLAAAPFARAQVEGSIVGTVLDDRETPVSNATVSLLKSGGNTSVYSTVTADDGSFTIPSLIPVTYGLRISSASGRLSLIDVAVRPGQPTVLRNLVLVPLNSPDPAASQSTAATAEESVQTSSTQIASTLEIPQLEMLPQSLRDPLQLLDTQVGVYTSNGASTINGLRPSLINVTIDGVNAQDNPNRAGTLNYLPSRPFLDQVSEFTLVTSNEASRFGFGAAQIAFATPSGLSKPLGATSSGQNDFHGDLFYLASPTLVNSNEWFSSANGVQGKFARNQGGATLGGALKKNKAFFYVNYELLRYKDSAPIRVYNLTAAGVASIDPSETTFINLEKNIPKATVPEVLSTGVTDKYFGTTTTTQAYRQNLDNFTGKVDFFASARNSISLSYLLSHDRSNPETGNLYDSTDNLNAPTIQSNDFRHLGSVSWRRASTSFVNEVRGGVSDLPVFFAAVGGLPTYDIPILYYNNINIGLRCQISSCLNPQALGVTANPLATVPQYLGNDPNQSYRYSRSYNAQDNASWIHNRHAVQFGFQLQRVQTSYQNAYSVPNVGSVNYNAPGTYCQTPAGINNMSSLCTLAIQPAATPSYPQPGLPFIYYQLQKTGSGYGFGPEVPTRFGQTTSAFYVQDTFRISSRLTAILGLRYELNRAPNELDGQFLAPNLAGQNVVSALLNPDTPFNFTSASVYQNRDRDFAPNFGIAYDPTGKGTTVIRSGYSISYANDDLLDAVGAAQTQNLYETVSKTPLANSINTAPVIPIPSVPSTLTARTLTGLEQMTNFVGYGDSGFSNAIHVGGVDPHLRTPYVQQWNFDVQRGWKGIVFDVRYVGNHATGLLRQVNLNQMNLNGKDAAGNTFLSDFLAYGSNQNASSSPFAANCATTKVSMAACTALSGGGLAGQAAAEYGGPVITPVPFNSASPSYALYRNNYAQRGVSLLGNFSHSSFHALQLDVNHRLGRNLQFQVNYTFAKVLSDSANATTGQSATTKTEYYRSAANPGLDDGPALFDIRHAIKANFYYLLPTDRLLTNPASKAILGGWSVSSIIIRQSGTPFSIISDVPTADFYGGNVFTTVNAPSGTANLISLRETPCGVFFISASALQSDGNCPLGAKPSVLSVPGAGQIGSVQPRSFYNPWGTVMNLGVEKTFRIAERQAVKVRMEATNLFNHASWYIPDGGNGVNITTAATPVNTRTGAAYSSTANFGQVFSTLYPSRKVQFTLLYRF